MKQYRVRPGATVDLSDYATDDTSGFDGKKSAGVERLQRLRADLEKLQELLYADRSRSVLVVLQGMDTSGKDGTIRRVFEGVNPQGVRVAQFRVPTPLEACHDFLWRIHAQAPAQGEIVIFNRSHYEDVLVARVHRLVSDGVWHRRYAEINAFEQLLVENGTTVLKFFLHLSEEEQKRRLKARLDDPTKHWKFSARDVQERSLWPKYVRAYAEAIERTSTRHAPWYIVPADRKWFRDLVVSEVLVGALRRLKMSYPPLPLEFKNERLA